MYAYCGNNPVNRSDPSGLDWNVGGFQFGWEDTLRGLAIGSNGALTGISFHGWGQLYAIPNKVSSSPYYEGSTGLGKVGSGALMAAGALYIAPAVVAEGQGMLAYGRFAWGYGRYSLMGGGGAAVGAAAATHPEEVQAAEKAILQDSGVPLYRLVDDKEAGLIEGIKGAVASLTSPFKNEPMTRVFSSEGSQIIKGWADYKNGVTPGFYTQVVTFPTNGSISAADMALDTRLGTYYVNIDRLNQALTSSPIFTPIDQFLWPHLK